MNKECKGEMITYSRVVGYYSPLNQWNKGAKAQYEIRKTFNINNAVNDSDNMQDKKVEYKSA